MPEIHIPPRYVVFLNAAPNPTFRPGQPAQVEVTLTPPGVFGIQDGRSAKIGEYFKAQFDYKTGELRGLEGLVLDPVGVEVSLGIGTPVTVRGNQIMWTEDEASTSDASQFMSLVEKRVNTLAAVLPLLSYYQPDVSISIATVVMKQESVPVGWAQAINLRIVMTYYKRETIEQQLRTLEERLHTVSLDSAGWWALVYYDRARRHAESPFLDDVYAEIIINYWKAAEAILNTYHCNQVESKARKRGLAGMAADLKWLCDRRNDDDVAHKVRSFSAEVAKTLNAKRGENVQKAERVVRAMIDRVLGIPSKE